MITWEKSKRFLYISKGWLIYFNVWRLNTCKRCQSWNVLLWKHRALKGYKCSAEQEETLRNTAKGAQNVLLAFPSMPPSFKSTPLLPGVLEGPSLAQSDKWWCNNSSSPPNSKCILGRWCFNSKTGWTKVKHNRCSSSTWQWLLRKLILQVPKYYKDEKAAVLTNHNRVKKQWRRSKEKLNMLRKEFGAAGCNYGKQTMNGRGEVAESSL